MVPSRINDGLHEQQDRDAVIDLLEQLIAKVDELRGSVDLSLGITPEPPPEIILPGGDVAVGGGGVVVLPPGVTPIAEEPAESDG